MCASCHLPNVYIRLMIDISKHIENFRKTCQWRRGLVDGVDLQVQVLVRLLSAECHGGSHSVLREKIRGGVSDHCHLDQIITG